MDSRIEELAEIILERAESFAKAIDERARTEGRPDEETQERYMKYRSISGLAIEMLESLHQYRINNPSLYD